MWYKKFKNILLFAGLFVVLGAHVVTATEYKYKITDPRYNTAVQYVTPQNGYETNSSDREKLENKQRNSQLLIILSMIVIPGFLIFSTIKNIEPKSQYRKKILSDEIKDYIKTIFSALINVLIVMAKKLAELIKYASGESAKTQPKYHTSRSVHTGSAGKKQTTETDYTPADSQKAKLQKTEETSHSTKSEFSINEYLSSPIEKTKNPILLSSSKLTKNKGLCLVQYKDKVSLIGYINKKVFVLAQFNSLSTNEIRSRLAENEGENERYIVKLGNYKALLEVSENNMELLLEL